MAKVVSPPGVGARSAAGSQRDRSESGSFSSLTPPEGFGAGTHTFPKFSAQDSSQSQPPMTINYASDLGTEVVEKAGIQIVGDEIVFSRRQSSRAKDNPPSIVGRYPLGSGIRFLKFSRGASTDEIVITVERVIPPRLRDEVGSSKLVVTDMLYLRDNQPIVGSTAMTVGSIKVEESLAAPLQPGASVGYSLLRALSLGNQIEVGEFPGAFSLMFSYPPGRKIHYGRATDTVTIVADDKKPLEDLRAFLRGILRPPR